MSLVPNCSCPARPVRGGTVVIFEQRCPVHGRPLTEMQGRALEYIRQHFAEHRRAPRQIDIAHHLGMHLGSGVANVLAALQRRGFIRVAVGQQRGITLLPEGASQ